MVAAGVAHQVDDRPVVAGLQGGTVGDGDLLHLIGERDGEGPGIPVEEDGVGRAGQHGNRADDGVHHKLAPRCRVPVGGGVDVEKGVGEPMGRAATGVVVGHDEVPPKSDSDMAGSLSIGRDVDDSGYQRCRPDKRLDAFTVGDAVLKDDDVGVRPARCSEPRRHGGGLMGLGAEQDQVERTRDRKGVGQHRHLALDSLLVEFDGDRVEWRAGGDRKRHFGRCRTAPRR